MVQLPDVMAPTPVGTFWNLGNCTKSWMRRPTAAIIATRVAEAFFVTHLAETQWIKKKNKGAVTPTFFAVVKGGLEVAFRFLL